MNFDRINDDLIEIDGRVRIERGPRIRTETATKALLSDAVTAGHYKVGGRDALGKEIVLGEAMTFIDWLSVERAWHVYRLEPDADLPAGRWVKRGVFDGDAEAMSAATALAAG